MANFNKIFFSIHFVIKILNDNNNKCFYKQNKIEFDV